MTVEEIFGYYWGNISTECYRSATSRQLNSAAACRTGQESGVIFYSLTANYRHCMDHRVASNPSLQLFVCLCTCLCVCVCELQLLQL